MTTTPSVAYEIFHTPFLCRIPAIYMYSAEYLAEAGTYTTGDPKMDMAIMREPLERYMTVAGMVLFHDEGAPITLVNVQDSVKIYQLLIDHLENWKVVFQTVLGFEAPPREDFIMMDRFARALHPIVMHCTNVQPIENKIHRRFDTVQGALSAVARKYQKRRESTDDGAFPIAETRDVTKHNSVAEELVTDLWRPAQ